MGSDAHYPEEAPARDVEVTGFWMSRTTVTNADFAGFVAETGYVTVAERPLTRPTSPGRRTRISFPARWSSPPTPGPVDLRHLSQWWTWTPGADWRHPDGPASDVSGRGTTPSSMWPTRTPRLRSVGRAGPADRGPVGTCARGVASTARPTCGAMSPRPRASSRAHYWHGDFPWRAESRATARRRRSVRTRPTATGCSTWPATCGSGRTTGTSRAGSRTPPRAACPRDPRGGSVEDSLDPRQPQFRVPRKVIKGGSFLCADSYCLRYRPCRATSADDRHRDESHRLPVRQRCERTVTRTVLASWNEGGREVRASSTSSSG